ncbi:MAG: hypothetical protein KBS69_06030 [Bacteroidales bacterium]|nr:hypothetical protein [Candidatus Colicola caccequi]
MKHLIKISDQFGTEFRTRSLVERLGQTLVPQDEYMFDMAGIEMISRSAADELYNIVSTNHVELIHMSPFVLQMYDAVKLGRFQPRKHENSDVQFVHCSDINQLATCL